jgi:hypothetical protein
MIRLINRARTDTPEDAAEEGCRPLCKRRSSSSSQVIRKLEESKSI